MRHLLLLLCWAAALAGCAKRGPDVHAEAEALAQQGKLEEAAAKVDLICAFAPDGDPCRTGGGRAAELRIQAADKAMTEGRFARAERLFVRALSTADSKAAEGATQRLASEDLKQGLAYERALGGSDKGTVMKAVEAIAATKTPVAAQAKAWLDRERPGLLVAAVKAACGPGHEGSCSEAAAALRAAVVAGPEAEAAIALAEEEERRVYPLRVTAEAFLKSFVAVKERNDLIETCKLSINAAGGTWIIEKCVNGGLSPGSIPTADEENERRTKRTANQTLWRRTMRSIADPALIRDLEERRAKAEEKGEYTKLDLPKPPKAPAGGRK